MNSFLRPINSNNEEDCMQANGHYVDDADDDVPDAAAELGKHSTKQRNPSSLRTLPNSQYYADNNDHSNRIRKWPKNQK